MLHAKQIALYLHDLYSYFYICITFTTGIDSYDSGGYSNVSYDSKVNEPVLR